MEELSPSQREAVTAPDGPVLVLAGAGSGKTRTIVHRIAYLLGERGVPPWSIVAVTFTNKAAGEMRQRVGMLMGESASSSSGGSDEVWLLTFHALGLRFLRRYGDRLGLPAGFAVYDEEDRRLLLRRVLRESGLSEQEYPVGRVAAALSAARNGAPAGTARWPSARERPQLEGVFARYLSLLREAGAVDFDDLLALAVELMERSEEARSFASRRCQHVLVDEYQDTNRVQYRLLRLLAPHGNLFVVGDEDQSIYTFRGAEIRNILDFDRDFPGARLVKLEENYRSTGAILEAANALIGHNRERKGKRLITRSSPGSRPLLYRAATGPDEAAFVAGRVEALRRESPSARVAVVFRTHAQSRLFEEEFVRRGIPHLLVGGQRFYERREVKDALAYLRLLLNPHDQASFLRVANVPPRGIGAATLELLSQTATERKLSLWDSTAALLDEGLLPPRAARGLASLREIRDSLAAMAPGSPLAVVVAETLARSGLLTSLQKEGSREAESRAENLRQLVAAAAEQEIPAGASPLAEFLDHTSLLTDLDAVKDEAPCLLMTLHNAKGLEFDAVFLAGLEEGLFPHLLSLGSSKALEEERRLCYVGMTRARRLLVLSCAEARWPALQKEGRSPSRFLGEIPAALLEVLARAGPAGPGLWPGAHPAAPGPFFPGVRVRHPLFGEGTVLDTEGASDQQKLTVRFRTAGRKKIVARYAGLEILRSR